VRVDTECTGTSLSVVHGIIWGNGGGDLHCEPGCANCYVEGSDIGGGWPGDGNIDANPSFADPGNGDYRLQPGSLAIDRGPMPSFAPAADLRGIVRPQDGDGDTIADYDMGAHEYLPPPVVTAVYTGSAVELSWQDNSPGMVYEVWRSMNPDLHPDDGVATLEDVLVPGGGMAIWEDPAGVGDPGQNYFYIVRVLTANGMDYGWSNRVGEFDFGIVPGS
jgi:hypothetical protein